MDEHRMPWWHGIGMWLRIDRYDRPILGDPWFQSALAISVLIIVADVMAGTWVGIPAAFVIPYWVGLLKVRVDAVRTRHRRTQG